MNFRFLLPLALGLCLPAVAQDAPPAVKASPPASVQSTLDSLDLLQRSIEERRKTIRNLEQQIRDATDEHTRNSLAPELDRQRQALDEVLRNFQEFALGIDLAAYHGEAPKPFNLQEELEKLIRPILSELKKATAPSRELEALRERSDQMMEQSRVASNAVANVDRLLAAKAPDPLRAELTALRSEWSDRERAAFTQAEGLRLQLEARLSARRSLLESTRSGLQNFFRTRGLNMLLGALAFCTVFFGLRGLYWLYRKLRPLPSDKSFSTRAIQLAYHIATTLFALLAMLLVFNLAGDWFLLGILILLLLGLAWATINTIPQHVERIKLMLNIGTVREREWLHYDGILWEVESIGFWAYLVNPLLDGGRQRLPVDSLMGQHSRVPGAKEEMFPCRAGDWVTLADGVFGRVGYQTPRMVQVVFPGGSQKVYPTPTFLSLSPANLSTGFRVETVFGIDYRHQAESTTTIPARMQSFLERRLADRVPPQHLRHVSVSLLRAGASSLDYRAVVDFDGAVASDYLRLLAALAELLVEACNEYGWIIPFPQLTVHKAGA